MSSRYDSPLSWKFMLDFLSIQQSMKSYVSCSSPSFKALYKTNAVHRSSRQENKQTNKSFYKKYVSS
jgi:hypothetical protein